MIYKCYIIIFDTFAKNSSKTIHIRKDVLIITYHFPIINICPL